MEEKENLWNSNHQFSCLCALQRFFKYLCIAAKVPEAIKLAQQALSDGKVSQREYCECVCIKYHHVSLTDVGCHIALHIVR